MKDKHHETINHVDGENSKIAFQSIAFDST